MIVATHNCGCPTKLPSLIPESVGLQAPCSPCCFQTLYGALHYSQLQTAQRYSKVIKKPKHIHPTSEGEACCCINRKSYPRVSSRSKYIPAVSLASVPSHCCTVDAFKVYKTASRRLVNAMTSASKNSVNKQFPRSRSQSKLKKLEIANAEQTSTNTIVSEIVRKDQPYKEIEAIINDNRVILRMHKEPVKEEYDPPCECVGQVASKESALNQRKCDDGVVFDMTHGNLELSHPPREDDAPLTKNTCEEAGCRTVTLYPNVKDNVKGNPHATHHAEDVKKLKKVRSIDLEENPNIFLLRIKKHCDSSDKSRQTIDLEFRAPRPWLPKKKKKDLLKSETLKEHKDDDEHKEYEDDIVKESKNDIDKEHKDDEEHRDGTYEKIDAYEKNEYTI